MSDDAVSSVDGRALARGILEEVWGGRNLAAYDNYAHSDVVVHVAGFPEPFRGLEAVKKWVSAYWSGFPDIEITIEDIIAEGNTVVARWSSRQTHLGTYLNMRATGKRASIEAVQLFHQRGDKFSEAWIMFDPLSILQQLGVLPTGTPPRSVIALLKTLTRLSRLAPKRS